MASARLMKLECDDLELVGYSVAGEETVVAAPSLDVCFDIGKAPDDVLPVNHVLLSHGHMDHAAGIAYYFSQRDFREMAPGTALVPASLGNVIEHLLDTWGRLDGSRPPGKIVEMEPGQEYEIRRGLFAYAFATNHCYGSLGFTVIDRRKKLKDEYLGLSGPEIVALKKKGVEITNTVSVPLVTYLGDTMGGDFEKLDCVRKSKVLIAECTFFDPDHHDRARAGRHYHFDALARVLGDFENEHVVLTHLSRRTDIRLARKAVDAVLAPELAGRVRFLMERPRRGKV